MRQRTIVTIGLLWVLLPEPGLADGWYGDLGLAFDFARDMSLDGEKAKFDAAAPVGSVAVGRYLGDRWRLELEWSYRNNDLEVIFDPDTGDEIRPDGRDGIQVHAFHLNALREFRLGALQPYLGVGVGPAHVRMRMGEVNNGGTVILPRRPILDDEAWVLGLQAVAGFSVPLSAKLDLAFDYRFWHAPSIEVTAESGAALDLEHTVHAGTVHLRYLFSGHRSRPSTPLRTADTGWYVAGSLGGGHAMDADLHDSLENLDAFQIGPVWSAALGYGTSARWRVELEAAQRTNDVEIVDFAPVNGQFRAVGDVKATSLAVNVLYRFRPDRAIRPFVGVGGGITHADYRIETRGAPYLDDADTAPVVQLLLGVDVALTPRLSFSADFRSWYTDWLEPRRPNGEKVRLPHQVNSLGVGLRFSM